MKLTNTLYNEVDYLDAANHIDSNFTDREINTCPTQEQYEGLAVIIHKLRNKFDDALDVWEDDEVSDYVTNLESTHINKLGKKYKPKEERNK
jgi:hypothetical protein